MVTITYLPCDNHHSLRYTHKAETRCEVQHLHMNEQAGISRLNPQCPTYLVLLISSFPTDNFMCYQIQKKIWKKYMKYLAVLPHSEGPIILTISATLYIKPTALASHFLELPYKLSLTLATIERHFLLKNYNYRNCICLTIFVLINYGMWTWKHTLDMYRHSNRLIKCSRSYKLT